MKNITIIDFWKTLKKGVNNYFNMAKFRNRIVHMYFNVSDEMIYEITQNNLEDFEEFIKFIVKLL